MTLRICIDVAFLNDGVVSMQGKMSDIKSQYRTEEYVLETEKEEGYLRKDAGYINCRR